ncbi:hypothetical protein Lal_00018143 [Lupinus albus]|uniref:Putative homogentisate solanesyltransferase n=1 Tax=Lupinus albus TaxID=3870 RepID=A0A6A5M2S0_LUPAL|nr:putative homogentisate solanesyltransferase [Lupinus albus]KAF1866758.1 hypothetical protein Lal_00018143 [Lupinus albus]
MSILSGMDTPTIDVDLGEPEKVEEVKEGDPLFQCDLCDTEVIHKLAQMLLPGLASACVDNTSGGLFKTPGSVADDLRKEMIDYVTQRSESFVAESVILEGGPDGEVSDHPFDIISNMVDDFVSLKRNFFSRVSGWLLSERREDKIEDFVQEMERKGFWTLDRRETIAETFLKNVDFENKFHCGMKINSLEELSNHVGECNFRSIFCENEGCNARFCASHQKQHDSTCSFKIIPCEQRCSDNIMRRDMDRHCITVCPMKLVNCPFHVVGCRSAIVQCMIDKHRSDDVHSHLWHLLKGTHKQANGEDLQRRVEEILQAESSSRLAQARDVRSLNLIVNDIEAKLGPMKVSAMGKLSAETVIKNADGEVGDTDTKGNKQSTQDSDMVSSLGKADNGDIVNIYSAENTAMTEDSEHSQIENKGSEEMTQTSNMVNPSYKAEDTTKDDDSEQGRDENKDSEERIHTSDVINLVDKAETNVTNDNGTQVHKENQDAPTSEILKGNKESTQTNLEKVSYQGEISAINEDNAETTGSNKYIEESSNFEDKDKDKDIQNSEVDTKGTAENIVKNKDTEYDGLKESIQSSKVQNVSD